MVFERPWRNGAIGGGCLLRQMRRARVVFCVAPFGAGHDRFEVDVPGLDGVLSCFWTGRRYAASRHDANAFRYAATATAIASKASNTLFSPRSKASVAALISASARTAD